MMQAPIIAYGVPGAVMDSATGAIQNTSLEASAWMGAPFSRSAARGSSAFLRTFSQFPHRAAVDSMKMSLRIIQIACCYCQSPKGIDIVRFWQYTC